jgi:WD40 repeat protein
LATGTICAQLSIPGDSITALAFAPEGRALVAGGEQGNVSLWDAPSGQKLGQQRYAGERIGCLVFSPDGKRLGIGTNTNAPHIWEVPSRMPSGLDAEDPDADLEVCWADLSRMDSAKAYRAQQQLAGARRRAMDILQRIRPAVAPQHARIAAGIANLDLANRDLRQEAAADLASLGAAAEEQLWVTLWDPPSHRVGVWVEELLDKLPEHEYLRSLRTVRVLEQIGDSEARQILEHLSQGAPGARVTEESRAALQRLTSRAAVVP